ncbi:hypothetical protein OB988_18590 [Bacillus cereus]|uniref:hypothetical protein n=1 Tax=Bacillus thuringiensis TaxID=1428 RepID=UPI000BFB93F4|nr:hypothetical protein [Bacillus thuringiensis]MCU5024477.1 hypothetical protein [Bacillus cereus]PGM38476.1 hypothetical protein CN945_01030 [Bacillus thuringiensis]
MAYKTPRNFIEGTYDATFNVIRQQEVKQPNGSVKTGPVKVIENALCGIYVHRAEEFDRRRSVQPETGDFRVYCAPEHIIHKGDKLDFTQYGRNYKTICGDPIVYETHQEVVCRQESVASGEYRDGNI